MNAKSHIASRNALFKTWVFLLSLCISSPYLLTPCPAKTLQVKFLFSFGKRGEKPGEFSFPAGISSDPNGNIYVADTGNNRIQKFDAKGKLLTFIGGFGWKSEQFQQPIDLTATNGLDIFVADYENERIERYDKDLNWIQSIYANPGLEERLRFGFPRSVSVSIHGDLFIVDGENKRVLKFNTQRQPEMSFGDYDWGEGALTEPARLFVSKQDKIYVTDPGAERIVLYDYYGNFLGFLGEKLLNKPHGICVDQQGWIFVTDRSKNQILVFDSKGELLLTCGAPGDKFGAFNNPSDITVVRNLFYVADTDNHRIQVFEIDPVNSDKN
jgi:tripartite motif-containing protein 71